MIRGNPVSLRRVLRLAIRGALAGLLSAAVALGVAELVAGITGPLSSPVIAVGGVVINLTPVPLKDCAIAHFGSNDKNVLLAGIVVQLAVFAAVIGILAVRWLWVGLAGLAVFGALGAAAIVSRSSALSDIAPTVIGVAVAAVAMVFLVRAARMEPRRRRLRPVRLPRPAVAAAPMPAGTSLNVSGITPFFSSNNSFYRVDIDLVVPQVSPEDWTLQITGMVDQGSTVSPAMIGTSYSVNGASVVCGNVQTANATVYIIGSVLMPK